MYELATAFFSVRKADLASCRLSCTQIDGGDGTIGRKRKQNKKGVVDINVRATGIGKFTKIRPAFCVDVGALASVVGIREIK